MSTAHPENPEDEHRDHSLLITEAQQRDFLERLTEIEHDVRATIRAAVADTPQAKAAAERSIADFSDITSRARTATRNAVTVEERIAHLDFTPNGPDLDDASW